MSYGVDSSLNNPGWNQGHHDHTKYLITKKEQRHPNHFPMSKSMVGVASIIGLKMIKRADITTFYFYWIISLGDYDTLPRTYSSSVINCPLYRLYLIFNGVTNNVYILMACQIACANLWWKEFLARCPPECCFCCYGMVAWLIDTTKPITLNNIIGACRLSFGVWIYDAFVRVFQAKSIQLDHASVEVQIRSDTGHLKLVIVFVKKTWKIYSKTVYVSEVVCVCVSVRVCMRLCGCHLCVPKPPEEELIVTTACVCVSVSPSVTISLFPITKRRKRKTGWELSFRWTKRDNYQTYDTQTGKYGRWPTVTVHCSVQL